ncbi:MAG: Zn-ribbon domain-containing OB-fold protein [Actinomycetes bacterium]
MTARWFPDSMPVPSANAETLPWWEAARDHRLVTQSCVSCKALRHPPGPICPECSSDDSTWLELSGRGTVYTYTVVHQQFVPADVPYVVIAVDLPEGVRMVSNLVEAAVSDVRIGMPVQVVWEDMGPELALPRFAPAP